MYLLSQGHHSLHTVLVIQGQIFVVIEHVLEGHVRVEVLAGPKIVAEASGSSGARSMLGELLAIPSNSATAKKNILRYRPPATAPKRRRRQRCLSIRVPPHTEDFCARHRLPSPLGSGLYSISGRLYSPHASAPRFVHNLSG